MSNQELCGTAAGYNILGASHTMTCEDCKTASRKWATGWFTALRNGPESAKAWAKANPPRTTTA